MEKETLISTIKIDANVDAFGKDMNLIVEGYWTKGGQLDWKVSSESECINAGLCYAN